MQTAPAPRFLDPTSPPHIVTLVLLTGLAALAMNVFLPSLPTMTEDFGTKPGVMQLTISLYLAVSALLQVVIGPISDRFGRRPVILGGLAIFVLASLGACLAKDVTLFLLFRMVQAAIATAMVLSRAIVRDMVTPDRAASMIGYITMGMSLVPMVGPVVGGVLDEVFGWRASFALLAIAGTATLALVWRDLGETMQPGARQGFAAQLRQYPELLGSPRFWGYCLSAALTSGGYFAFLGGAPHVGVEIHGLSPAELGYYFGAPAVGYAFGNFLSGRYSVRLGLNRMVLIGTLTAAAGMGALAVLTIAGFQTPAVFFGFIVFLGLGNGLALPSANAGIVSVRPQLAGTASGLGGALMIGGGAAFSVFAVWTLGFGGGAIPLVLTMFASTALAVLTIALVIRRARRLGL
ncbi:MAG: multidrug effflux MFS transporter [Paracoccaceae bacterium]